MMLSVIIPVYNSEQYLFKCIKSIVNQTYSDLEILIIDDGSTDSSKTIATEFAKSDKRIKVFSIPNSGVSAARNIGIENAQGELVAFVDSDDTIKPDMYEKLIGIYVKYGVDLVSSDLIINGDTVTNNIPENCVINKEQIEEKVLPLFTYENSIGTMAFTNKIIKTEVLKNNGIEFYKGFQYQEDLMFMINIYANINSMFYMPEAFYEYVTHTGGLYSSYRADGGEKFISARKKMLELIEKYKIKNINYLNFNNSFLYNITYYLYRTSVRIQEPKKCKKMLKEILNNDDVILCCKSIAQNASSFDKRIARAIVAGHKGYAMFLIKLVYSGKIDKMQYFIGKVLRRSK